ncbi:DUF6421 family protein [Couchioplanes azureus]|uniref:DUF6421 family protein n=1 Tax=Couchioplanes caeruleus TaxID=56438 RepID=UPI00167002BC|nr:DUF6421 family protein [Couchioplanes caeruleus]GGQ69889.1 hypothetical protein GCM10010166_44650 [Couchioplanes caeruleus subsp. azureus]
MNPRALSQIVEFERRIVPAAGAIRAAQVRADGRGPDVDVDALCRDIERLDALMPAGQIEATVHDVRAWSASDFRDPPAFDATRDAVPAPRDREAAAFVGPVTLPNGDGSSGAFLEAFTVVRQDPDCIAQLQAAYPHPNAVFQSTRLLSASPGLRDGNCVVFFPENIPTVTPTVDQTFAWFFFNRHVDIYAGTLDIVSRLCADGSPFAGERQLCSVGVDPEDVYQARCVWGYLHDYFHHTGPRPLDQNLALKTKWRTGVLEELKVDMKSAIACLEEPVPYGEIIFEYIVLERLFRYPAEPRPFRNFDSGTGFALGTWLAEHKLFTVGDEGRRTLGSKAEIAASVRELVRSIEEIETIEDDDVYRETVTDFLYDRLLRRPDNSADRCGGPRAPLSLWGAEVHV